jgi:hypothetical protein
LTVADGGAIATRKNRPRAQRSAKKHSSLVTTGPSAHEDLPNTLAVGKRAGKCRLAGKAGGDRRACTVAGDLSGLSARAALADEVIE